MAKLSNRRDGAEKSSSFRDESLAGEVGRRIRAIRESKGISARELAARAGMDPGYLSRLENGRLRATVATLARVMNALGVPVADVFGDDVGGGPVVRKRERRLIRSRGVDDFLLSPSTTGRLEVMETIIGPEGGSGTPAYSHPGDEECVVVLEGRLDMWLDDQRYELRRGDSITFNCRTPHRWVNPGKARTRVIWIITPAGY